MAAQNKAWLDAAIALALEANALSRETAGFPRRHCRISRKAKAGVGNVVASLR